MLPMTKARTGSQKGFTLVEMSMVLLVIALIIGAVSVGGDLQRNAVYQKVTSGFIRGWQLSYDSYLTKAAGIRPGDTSNTGLVMSADPTLVAAGTPGTQLCGAALRNMMIAAGVEMPQGRAEGSETVYSYLDSNGNPQEVEVCFQAIAWDIPSGPATYSQAAKNVMVIKRLTPDLARMLDSTIDTVSDAQFGKVREYSIAGKVNPVTLPWSIDNTSVYSGTQGEGQIQVVTAAYLMQ